MKKKWFHERKKSQFFSFSQNIKNKLKIEESFRSTSSISRKNVTYLIEFQLSQQSNRWNWNQEGFPLFSKEFEIHHSLNLSYTVRRTYVYTHSMKYYIESLKIWTPHRVHQIFYKFETQCEKHWNLFSHFLTKISWKQQRFLLKKLPKMRFHKIFFRWEWISHFSTLWYIPGETKIVDCEVLLVRSETSSFLWLGK